MKLQPSVGKIYGYDYWTIHPRVDDEVWDEMFEWMNSMFGSSDDSPYQRWYTYAMQFWFLNEEDAMLFLLRWS